MNRVENVLLTLTVVGGFALGMQDLQSTQAHSLRSAGIRPTADQVVREYRGIKLGMKREEVRAALGKPEALTDTSDDFKLTGEDTMTVHYDGEAVKAIQIAILDPKNAPPWKEVVGDAEVTEMANGAKSARKTLVEEKFWVAMYQSKDGATTRITISRM